MKFQFASCLYFLLFYCSYLNIQIPLASGHCLDDQTSLLLQLNDNLTFNPLYSGKLVLWNQSLETDCYKWRGVSCDKEGHVTGLDLSEEYISGELSNSSSLFSLKDLQKLNPAYNKFNGTIPYSISTLKELTYLDLSYNNSRGPISFAYFDLHLNSLNGSIPSSFFALPSLREICLSFNQFDGELDELSNLSNSATETIHLGHNNLEGLVPKSIFHLSNLRRLYLSFNKFNGTVYLDMIQSHNLIAHGLSHNNLSIDINDTEAYLSSFHSVSYLWLASCNFRSFPVFLRNQSMLHLLDLSNNQIQGRIPKWIWRLDFLQQLNLSNNLLTGLGAPLWNPNTGLTVLDLHSNKFHGQLPVFPPSVTYLDFSNNKFNSVIPHNIDLSLMEFLFLSNNDLHGSVPDSFCNASGLQFLDLSHNKFNGRIPQCLTQSHLHTVLNMQDNMLNGSYQSLLPIVQD